MGSTLDELFCLGGLFERFNATLLLRGETLDRFRKALALARNPFEAIRKPSDWVWQYELIACRVKPVLGVFYIANSSKFCSSRR
ncbi:hypothetical protein RSSM_05619 [Rhodopirellula sallentina SM41]|uniref:Uncharacterized protein n=1 Tax=Rhodopirellula sallentina SM41 TaxID=1263870 RepID=M5TUV6_9BACT|nr:hypothetical protein RSSM_05619 [Rhodopirellula sallentina SM41]